MTSELSSEKLDAVLARIVNQSYRNVEELSADMDAVRLLCERKLVVYDEGGFASQPSVRPTPFALFFLRNGGFSSEHRLAKAEKRSVRAERLTIISLTVTIGTLILPAILDLLRHLGIEL